MTGEGWDIKDFERTLRDAIREDNRRVKEFAGEGWMRSVDLFDAVGLNGHGLVIEMTSGEVFEITVKRCTQ